MKTGRDNIGEAFQAATKYRRDEMPAGGPDWEARPEPFKVYETPINRVGLPAPQKDGGAGVWGVLAGRRTRRTYRPEPVSLAEVSQLLWAANGRTGKGRGELALRSAPSAGALYPIELYLMANDVDGLEPGIYHYDVPGHGLSFIRQGGFGQTAADASLGQAMLAKSGAVVFMTAVTARCTWKYRQRAYRYIYLDAGHIGQNICIACGAMSLGACPIGAFYDDELNAVLGVDAEAETVIYAMAVGR